LEGKKCFKCYGYEYFQIDCPLRKALIIREVEEIQAIEEKSSEEEVQNNVPILVTPDVGELLVIRRALHPNKAPLKYHQREKIFHTRCTIRGKVHALIIDKGSCCMNMTSMTPIDELQSITKMHDTHCKYTSVVV